MPLAAVGQKRSSKKARALASPIAPFSDRLIHAGSAVMWFSEI
jgi:hypothetical protein